MRTARLAALSLIVTIGVRPVGAQATPPQAVPVSRRLDAGIVAGAEWMQANALPMDRDAIHSGAFDISLRRNHWAFNVGWLRIARTLSTVQGGTVSVGRLFSWKDVLFIPAIAGLGGQTYASRDSTGYNFIDPQGLSGHVPRYSYSDGATFGGGASLTIEYPVYRFIGVRASAAQWFFSGHPLEDDRGRTVIGLGLSLRVKR